MNDSLTPKGSFFLGEEWLYYKFYCGPKTGDRLLGQCLLPLVDELERMGQIDRWFFIRYADPGSHIRFRLHLTQTDHLGPILLALKDRLAPLVSQGLVWRTQTDTYQRELERYGRLSMVQSEAFFHFDSRMVAGIVALLDGDAGEELRWHLALRASDRLLDDFDLSLAEKADFIAEFRDGYGREFGMNKDLKQRLEGKYRQNRKIIEQVLGAEASSGDAHQGFYQLIDERSRALRPLATEINGLVLEPDAGISRKELLQSYLHMMNNRFFRSRQRLHELVLYDFLSLYYRSQLAREKQLNAQAG
jgi:thiopeptide-type bacteriocin biosynthesis protein